MQPTDALPISAGLLLFTNQHFVVDASTAKKTVAFRMSKKQREEFKRDQRIAHTVGGAIVGAALGAGAGLRWGLHLTPFQDLHPWDTILISATILACFGYYCGDALFDWLSEHCWWWFP